MSFPGKLTEQELESHIAWINWRAPVTITTPDCHTDFGCRFCIAQFGLKSKDVQFLPKTREEFYKHMIEAHGGKNEQSSKATNPD